MNAASTLTGAASGWWSRGHLILAAALTMAVGWGLRGFIGGGPLGAMIPGALVALVLAQAFRLDPTTAALTAAFGAVGIGFGGQETYGQTVRLVTEGGADFWRGVIGLTLKGGVWGLTGGAVLATALVSRRLRPADLRLALVALVLGTALGWKLVDDPKLLYFSNRLDRPRAELWAGLLGGGLAYLGVFRWRAPTVFRTVVGLAVAGSIGGGVGFGVGGVGYAWGLWLGFSPDWYPGWKQMEFTFGACFGAGLAIGAWRLREMLAPRESPPAASPAPSVWPALAGAGLGAALLGAATRLGLRFDFTVGGAALLALAWTFRAVCWQIALTLTAGAFCFDVAATCSKKFADDNPVPGQAAALIASLIIAAIVAWRPRSPARLAAWAFDFLLWLGIAAALVGAVGQHRQNLAFGFTVLAFVLGGAAATFVAKRADRA